MTAVALPYPHMLPPGPGRTTLKNRVLMGSMHVGLEEAPTALSAWPPSTPARQRAVWTDRDQRHFAPNVLAHAGRRRHDHAEKPAKHKIVTQAVHQAGGKIAMQILHFGRRVPPRAGGTERPAGPSAFIPHALTDEVETDH